MVIPYQDKKEKIYQGSWKSGMLTSLPPEELPPDAAQILLNVEFDEDSNLVSRNGTFSFLDTNLSNARITSLFRAEFSDGTIRILFTAGNQLYRCNENGTGLTTITGGLTLPDNVFWQWVMFDDFAIGVNGSDPIKVNSSGNASILNANAPDAKFCEVWNSRLWLSGVGANANTIFASAINNPEDWTTTGDAGAISLGIDINDGDAISGLKAFRGDLFVYKRRKINVISPISAPATLPSNLRVDIYTTNIGCVSGYTIQSVLDDQLFLSPSGVISLTLAPLGELRSAIVSDNIAELQTLKQSTSEVSTFVFDDMNQYLLSLPSSISKSGFDEAWVMDYSKINQRDAQGRPFVRWVKMTGGVAGTAYCEKLDGDFKSYIIAQHPIPSTDTFLYSYTPNSDTKIFSDNGDAYTQQVRTKAYTTGSALERTIWQKFGLSMGINSPMLNLTVRYYFNNKYQSPAGEYTFLFTSDEDLAFYGSILYGTGEYTDSELAVREAIIWQSFRKNESGRKARTMALDIMTDQANQGFILKFVQINAMKLNERRARTV